MVWYLVPSLDPELRVAVGWVPVLGSFIGRVEGVPTGALLDPDRATVAWFGSRQGSCRQSRISRTPSATTPSSAAGCGPPWRRIGSVGAMSWSRHRLWDRWALLVPGSCPALSSWGAEPSTRRALLELALMVAILLVVLILGLLGIMAGVGNR